VYNVSRRPKLDHAEPIIKKVRYLSPGALEEMRQKIPATRIVNKLTKHISGRPERRAPEIARRSNPELKVGSCRSHAVTTPARLLGARAIVPRPLQNAQNSQTSQILQNRIWRTKTNHVHLWATTTANETGEPMRDCFPFLIKARAPSVLREAIKVAAERELTTPSEWMRRALLRQLREQGIDPQTVTQQAA
jgi:hypothetical protein